MLELAASGLVGPHISAMSPMLSDRYPSCSLLVSVCKSQTMVKKIKAHLHSSHVDVQAYWYGQRILRGLQALHLQEPASIPAAIRRGKRCIGLAFSYPSSMVSYEMGCKVF